MNAYSTTLRSMVYFNTLNRAPDCTDDDLETLKIWPIKSIDLDLFGFSPTDTFPLQ